MFCHGKAYIRLFFIIHLSFNYSVISTWKFFSRINFGHKFAVSSSPRLTLFCHWTTTNPTANNNSSSTSVHLKLFKKRDNDESDVENETIKVQDTENCVTIFEAYGNDTSMFAITVDDDKHLNDFYRYLYPDSSYVMRRNWTANLSSVDDAVKLMNLWKTGKVLSISDLFPFDRRSQRRSFPINIRNSVSRMKGLLQQLENDDAILNFLVSQNISDNKYDYYIFNDTRPVQETIATLKKFADWFRQQFPYYHDKCEYCGNSGSNSYVGVIAPNVDELAFDARSVEAFVCSNCCQFTKFPRYNNVDIVLRTKRGRCGEYSALIVRMLKALKYNVRWVSDIADHLWAEVFIGDRWIHIDPCEAAVDEPLIYQGWGKNQTYIIAYDCQSRDVADVTKSYTTKIEDMIVRRKSDNMTDTVVEGLLIDASKNLSTIELRS